MTDPFLILPQVSTQPTALTSFYRGSHFSHFSVSHEGNYTFLHYPTCIALISKLQRLELRSLPFLFLFPVTLSSLSLSLPLSLWLNTSALISWFIKCCAHSLLLSTPYKLSPPPRNSSLTENAVGEGSELSAQRMNAASL